MQLKIFFIREFDLIFREQPIVDVGIDAPIEQSENGNPTGKFIALQNELPRTLCVEVVH